MFVFSLRANRPKLVALLCLIFAVLLALVIFIKNRGELVAKTDTISYKASTQDERTAFLSQFGWEIDTDPVEVAEVIIPSEFNDTYSSYNQIQKNQELDLEAYKGKRVKRWVYEVKNYPGYASDSGCIRATLLVYDGIVIGGDVSSLELDGFTQGFDFPEEVTTSKSEVSK